MSARDHELPETPRLAPADAMEGRASDHFVQFYDDEAGIVDAVSHFVGEGLDEGGTAILIANARLLTGVTERMTARGIDLPSLEKSSRYAGWDTDATLAKLMVDGWPDPHRFSDVIERVIARAASEHREGGVRVYGDMVTRLWVDGRREAALRLEKLWNELRRRHAFSLFCGYPMGAFDVATEGRALMQICSEHGHVIHPESLGSGTSAADRLRVILQLQQKSRALDEEIVRRKELEDTLRRREKELAHLLDNTLDGIIDVTPDGRIVGCNKAMLDLLGYETADASRPHVESALVTRQGVDDAWSRLVRGERVRAMLVEFRGRDAMPRHARLHSGILRTTGRAVQMRWFVRPEPEA
jgi:PAS domain S-box-containing protein